jgi:Ca2+-binding RTX toxin-like protein
MTEFIENISGRSFDNTPNTSLINGTLNLLHAGYTLVNSGTYVRYGEVNTPHYDESYLHQFEDGTSYLNAWRSDAYTESTLDANGNPYGSLLREGAPLSSLWQFAPRMILFDRNNSSYLFTNVTLPQNDYRYDLFSFNDYLSTGNENDIIFGAGGDDTIIGGGGNDFISGGVGFNILTGGSGADEFAFVDNVTGGRARITDYNYSEGDSIDIKRTGESEFADANTTLFIARNKKKYKRAMKTSSSFILDSRNKRLLYNADGATKGLGYSNGGGVLIEFDNFVQNIDLKFY